MTSGLLRIYQAQKLNTRFFIIGPKDVLKKFEKEIEKAPFNAIKQKCQFGAYEVTVNGCSFGNSSVRTLRSYLPNPLV